MSSIPRGDIEGDSSISCTRRSMDLTAEFSARSSAIPISSNWQAFGIAGARVLSPDALLSVLEKAIAPQSQALTRIFESSSLRLDGSVRMRVVQTVGARG
jgi:hypothetical protein